MGDRKLTVCVIGAGIAGLAASIALAEKGHSVTILEAAPTISDVGAGIQLPPNSVRILKELGVYREIAQHSTWPRSIILKRWENGNVLTKLPLLPDLEEAYSVPYLLIHRADLHHVLLDKAYASGVEIRLGTYVSSIDEAEPSVGLRNGNRFVADLVVGADGIKSNVRKIVLDGEDVGIRFSPSCVYRTLIPATALKSIPLLQPLVDDPAAIYWLGPRGHIIGYPISNGTVYNFVLCDSSTPPVGLISKVVPLSEIQTRFADWEPVVRQLIDLVPEPLKWQLAEIEEPSTWVSKSGKVIVIGDASHAMVPHLAQGAAMALEDAIALATCIDRAESTRDLPILMKHFQDMRRERCAKIQREAWELGEAWHLPDGPEQSKRDQQMIQAGYTDITRQGEYRNPNRWGDLEFQPLLFGYDASREATSYLDSNYVETKCG